MKLIVTLEYRFKRTPDGKVWTEMSFQYPFWKRYLKVFDQVTVVARILDVEKLETPHHLVSGKGLIFFPISYYHGPKEFIFVKNKIRNELKTLLYKYPDSAIIMRVGSPIADILQNLIPKNRPYALEVVGDPWEVFRPGTINNPLRPFMRWYFTKKLKKQCSKATAISYVTEKSLQRRYPGPRNCFTINASTIELLPEHIIEEVKNDFKASKKTFVFVGTLEQLQKGTDLIIKAAKIVKEKQDNFMIKIIGDGKYRTQLESEVKKLGLMEQIEFKGLLPAGEKIRNELDNSDFFILPSRGEGLPRAMIEAMARALPCIGSDIGGIKELIEPDEIVKVGTINELAFKMLQFLNSSPEELKKIAQRNLKKSHKYLNSELEKRRTDFYLQLQTKTKAWKINES